MLNCAQFRDLILIPLLGQMQMFSDEAISLMLGTLANESNGGSYLAQEGGPALGIYQMEPRTHDDIWKNYLPHQPVITHRLYIAANVPIRPNANDLVYNLRYATLMARILYWRIKEPIPKDIPGQAAYYKKYYNTNEGRATVEGYIANHERFTGAIKPAVRGKKS